MIKATLYMIIVTAGTITGSNTTLYDSKEQCRQAKREIFTGLVDLGVNKQNKVQVYVWCKNHR